MRARTVPKGNRSKSNRPSTASTCPCSCVSPTSLRGRTHGRVPTRVGCPPAALPFRHSPEPGVPLDGGAAGGRRVAAVEAEGSPAAVHQQLVAVRVVPDHPGEDADGHVLQPAGTQLGLLKVWGTRVPGSGWPVSLPGEGPDPTRSP